MLEDANGFDIIQAKCYSHFKVRQCRHQSQANSNMFFLRKVFNRSAFLQYPFSLYWTSPYFRWHFGDDVWRYDISTGRPVPTRTSIDLHVVKRRPLILVDPGFESQVRPSLILVQTNHDC